MKPYIYLRGLRHVDLSVFCVESGQKVYWTLCSALRFHIQVDNK